MVGSEVELKRVAGVGLVDKEMYSMCHVVRMSGYETPWADVKDSDLTAEEIEACRNARSQTSVTTAISEALQDRGVLMKNAGLPSLSNVLTRNNFDKAIRHRGRMQALPTERWWLDTVRQQRMTSHVAAVPVARY